MVVSAIDIQRDIILDTIRKTSRGDWKVLVLDDLSKKLIDNVVKEDDILHENVTNIEQIEQRRPMNPDTDAVYILSPLPHIVDCLVADLERRRYRSSYLVWTSVLDPRLRKRVDATPSARDLISGFRVLSIDFFPRESHLVTFRDPWSFPTLFHPSCNSLVGEHMKSLSLKIVSLCVSLGEYPIIRYYRPRNPQHEASVLCQHLARFVQDELDTYAQYHAEFPPQVPRPRGALLITDRAMDLVSPLVHEFTYQAMAHDLLPIREGEKVLFKTTVNEGEPNEEVKDMEIGEKDRIWVENRHRHMKDTIEKLMGDFQKFIQDNPHFAQSAGDKATSLNAIKDMLAGLPEFQELKEAYSLHLSMAQECMNIFQHQKLPDLASVEQSLATGLDEDFRKPKNLAEQVVRSLDDDSVAPADRLRLILLYLLYRRGLVPVDATRLLAHAQLPPQDGEVIQNLELLGARVQKPLKDSTSPPTPLFAQPPRPTTVGEEYALSRFNPALRTMLDEFMAGTLDATTFPYTKPQLDADPNGGHGTDNLSQASLRSAKPTWAKTRLAAVAPRQRVIVFMAGGATYSEARACYDVSTANSRDVFLATSHMVTPSLFLRQVGDLSVDRRRLDLPLDRPKPKAPQHLFEQESRPKPLPTPSSSGPSASPAPGSKSQGGGGKAYAAPLPPVTGMHTMSLDPSAGANGRTASPALSHKSPSPAPGGTSGGSGGKLKKEEKGRDSERDRERDDKKKKHHFWSR